MKMFWSRSLERVQAAVGVLLELAEVDEVVLVAVGVAGAEDPGPSVDVGEDEARGSR